MNPILKKISQTDNPYFLLMKVDEPHFFPLWHFHPEYEIILIEEGCGTKYLGNSVVNFQAGDLTLIGPNTPHLYKSSIENRHADISVRALVVYFKEALFDGPIFNTSESRKIKEMLALSRFGIGFSGITQNLASFKLKELYHKKGFDKILSFFEILNILSNGSDYGLITNSEISARMTSQDQRVNVVYEYVLQNFTSKILLADVAELACMNPNAFCRYFKKRTNLTFVSFVNGVRISNACKLLAETEMPVKRIGYESGFNNFSAFLNAFKKITELTPQQYREIQLSKQL